MAPLARCADSTGRCDLTPAVLPAVEAAGRSARVAWLWPLPVLVAASFLLIPGCASAGGTFFGALAIVLCWPLAAFYLICQVTSLDRGSLGCESLRPVTRAGFVQQWGAGILWRLAILQIALALLWGARFGFSLGSAPSGAGQWWSLWMALVFVLASLAVWLRTLGTHRFDVAVTAIGLLLLAVALMLPGLSSPVWSAGPPGLLPTVATGLFYHRRL